MDCWVVGQISFWYTFYEVKPAVIVDKLVQFWVDLATPGRGAGESSWWMRGFRSLERTSERTSRELDIRRELRIWDDGHPQLHHELIVRYICGALVSVAATSFYHSLTRSSSRRSAEYRRYS